MVLQQQAAVAVDAAQGRLEVMGDGIGEGLQLLVDGGQLGGPGRDALLQFGVEAQDLVLDPLAFRDIAHHQDELAGLRPRAEPGLVVAVLAGQGQGVFVADEVALAPHSRQVVHESLRRR